MSRPKKGVVGEPSRTEAGKGHEIQAATPPIMHPPAFGIPPGLSSRKYMEQAFLSSFVLKGGQAMLDTLMADKPEVFLDYMLKFQPKEPAGGEAKSIEDILNGMKIIDGNSEEVPDVNSSTD